MVRIKYSALVKLFALCFFCLFIIPSMLKLLNGPNEDEIPGMKIAQPDDGGGGGPAVIEGPRIVEVEREKSDAIRNELAAVFKDGVLGNYEEVNPERRSGPGEGGVAVQTEPEARGRADATVREFGFNMYASDKISLDRRIKDTRPAEYDHTFFSSLDTVLFYTTIKF